MAIYHCSTKPISRASGRSATASSAYRSASKIVDRKTGEVHDYTRKQGVVSCEIVMPDKLKNISIDREELWNKSEEAEKRKDGRVAREWVVAIPHELSEESRKEVAKEYAKYLANKYEVIADIAIHEPSKNGDDKNHHAHIMVTTRQAKIENDEIVLGDKAEIELSNKKRASLGLKTSQEEIKKDREQWANIANKYLKREGIDEEIDHRSYEDQGIDLVPTIHEGVVVTEQRRKGNVIGVGLINDKIKEENSFIKSHIFEKEMNRKKGFFEKIGIKKVEVKEIKNNENIKPISQVINDIDFKINTAENEINSLNEMKVGILQERQAEKNKKVIGKYIDRLTPEKKEKFENYLNDLEKANITKPFNEKPDKIIMAFAIKEQKFSDYVTSYSENRERLMTKFFLEKHHQDQSTPRKEIEELADTFYKFEQVERNKEEEKRKRIEANKKEAELKQQRIKEAQERERLKKEAIEKTQEESRKNDKDNQSIKDQFKEILNERLQEKSNTQQVQSKDIKVKESSWDMDR